MLFRFSDVKWTPSWRLVPSRFPTIGPFDKVATAEDFDIVVEIEGLTNDRLREDLGDLSLVPVEDRIFGEGTTPIMATFTHLNPEGSRFSDGSYGVYYAAKSVDTAVAETIFHRERFLKVTKEAPMEIDMRSYASEVDNQFHDIRDQRDVKSRIYDPDSYGSSQSFSAHLRKDGSNGIVYASVRDPGGECIAVFKPRLLSPVVQGPHYCYVWDGASIVDVYVKAMYERSR